MNHLGDWGTQFGMLTQHMLDTGTTHLTDFAALGELYRDAKARFDADAEFADAARRRVVALQAGDPATIALLAGPRGRLARAHQRTSTPQLDVTLTDEDVTGESFYNDRLRGRRSTACSRRASRSRATARWSSSPSASPTRTARPRC